MGAIIAEFSIAAGDFVFGDALLTDSAMEVVLERVVPTGDSVIPYIWVRNGDFQEFERSVESEANVSHLRMIDEVEERRLYRIDWTGTAEDLFTGINDAGGVILEGVGGETWHFRLRFDHHENLKQFYNHIIEERFNLTLDRIYDLRPDGEAEVHGLSSEQLEALKLAIDRGYFSVPREVSIQELADELGISDQAMSERLRRGLDATLRTLLPV